MRLAAGLMPGMRKAADAAVASLLRHLTAKKGPNGLDLPIDPPRTDHDSFHWINADVPLDGCGLMPEQQRSKASSWLLSLGQHASNAVMLVLCCCPASQG